MTTKNVTNVPTNWKEIISLSKKGKQLEEMIETLSDIPFIRKLGYLVGEKTGKVAERWMSAIEDRINSLEAEELVKKLRDKVPAGCELYPAEASAKAAAKKEPPKVTNKKAKEVIDQQKTQPAKQEGKPQAKQEGKPAAKPSGALRRNAKPANPKEFKENYEIEGRKYAEVIKSNWKDIRTNPKSYVLKIDEEEFRPGLSTFQVSHIIVKEKYSILMLHEVLAGGNLGESIEGRWNDKTKVFIEEVSQEGYKAHLYKEE